jgi:RNA polymerase sigma-70 factor (ECF subfamily)
MEPKDEKIEGRWAAWMAAAQDGDAAAYERLLRELAPVLRSFVSRRLAAHDAREDVVQNALLAIHRSRHTYRPERPFGPWWRAVARNAVIDTLRAGQRRGRREVVSDALDEVAAVPAPEPAPVPDPALGRALASLPESQRQAVELVYVQELSVAEAAERAGVTPGALKVRVHRGLRALRRIMKGELP